MEFELLRANLVRTLVPLLVGALFTLTGWGGEQVATLLGFAVSAGYYAVFRVAETRYPWLGVFLGKRMVRGTPAPAAASLAGNAAPAAGTPAGSVRVIIDIATTPAAAVVVEGLPTAVANGLPTVR